MIQMRRGEESKPTPKVSDVLSFSSIHNIDASSTFRRASAYSEFESRDSLSKHEVVSEFPQPIFSEKGLACPACGAPIAFFALGCPKCGSSEVLSGKILEHIACRNLDIESFSSNERGVIFCSKCGGSSGEAGYAFKSIGYKCLGCSLIIGEPMLLVTCPSCGYSTRGRSLRLGSIEVSKRPSYSLSSLDPLIKSVRAKGWRAIPLKGFVGKSGVEHEFSLIVLSSSAKETYRPNFIVAEIISANQRVSEIQVLTFFAKTMDVGARKKILVAIPKVEEEARKFANSYDIALIESPTVASALQALSSKISEFIELGARKAEVKRQSCPKRTSFDIIADILTIAERPISKTEILYRANLSFRQAEKYLSMLEKMELLKRYFEDGVSRRFVTTQKGQEYLLDSLKQFGRISEGSKSVWGSKISKELL